MFNPMTTSDQALLIKHFISIPEQEALRKWGHSMLPFLRPNGHERAFMQVYSLPSVPEEYEIVRRRLQNHFGVTDEQREPKFGWYLGSIGEGGMIHEHRDPAPEGLRHLRCNLFVQTPDSGGEPVIEDVVQPYEERMLLCFFPSEQRHRSNRVNGSSRRITCSFGYLVGTSFELAGVRRNWKVVIQDTFRKNQQRAFGEPSQR